MKKDYTLTLQKFIYHFGKYYSKVAVFFNGEQKGVIRDDFFKYIRKKDYSLIVKNMQFLNYYVLSVEDQDDTLTSKKGTCHLHLVKTLEEL